MHLLCTYHQVIAHERDGWKDGTVNKHFIVEFIYLLGNDGSSV